MLKFTKPVALAIVIMMAISLYGCNQTDPNKTGESTTSVTATEATQQETTDQPKTPVTLKVMLRTVEVAFPNGIQDDPVMKEVEKRTGITVDWIIQNSFSDFETYQNTLLASGDLPDIMCVVGSNDKYFKPDAVLALDDLIQTNGKDILANAKDMIDASKAFNSNQNDNKLYFLSNSVNDTGKSLEYLQMTPFIRWDLYKEIGTPKVDTPDDLLAVLKQMQDKAPKNSDGKLCYGLAGWFGDSWGYVMPERIYAASYGWQNVAGDVLWVNRNEGLDKLYGKLDDNAPLIKGLEFWNKAYNMGIVDPDTAVMKFDQYTEKCKAGRVYFGTDNWCTSDIYNPAAAAAGTPEKGFMPVWDWAKNISKLSVYSLRSVGDNAYFITKKCKTPDRAMDFMNFLFTVEGSKLLLNGIEGTDWKYVNNIPVMTDEFKAANKTDSANNRIKTGVFKYHPIIGLGSTMLDPQGGYPLKFTINIEEKTQNLTAVEKDYSAAMGVKMPFEKWFNHPDASYDFKWSALPSREGEANDLYTKFTNYLLTNMIKVIVSKDFAAAKTEFVNGANAIGYDKLVELQKAKYYEVRTKLGD